MLTVGEEERHKWRPKHQMHQLQQQQKQQIKGNAKYTTNQCVATNVSYCLLIVFDAISFVYLIYYPIIFQMPNLMQQYFTGPMRNVERRQICLVAKRAPSSLVLEKTLEISVRPKPARIFPHSFRILILLKNYPMIMIEIQT